MATSLQPSTTSTSEQAIDEFQIRAGIVLPSEYRAFLLRTNGGRCVGAARFRSLREDSELSEVDTFLGVSENSHESLEQNISNVADLLPTGLIPVAYDGGGNYLLLDCARGSSSFGSVYFSTLEGLDELGGAAREDLTLVASSFGELLAQIGLLL